MMEINKNDSYDTLKKLYSNYIYTHLIMQFFFSIYINRATHLKIAIFAMFEILAALTQVSWN